MKQFLKSFKENKGIWVSISMMVSKISMFFLVVFVAKILPKEEFGIATQAVNFLAFFVPLLGMGSYQGLLRFGSMINNPQLKENLFRYTFFKGILGQIFITILMFVFAVFFFGKDSQIFILVLVLGIRFFGLFLLELQRVKFRNDFRNEKFALLEMFHSIFGLVSGVCFAYFYGFYGYIFSLCLSPFVVLFFFSSIRGTIAWNFSEITTQKSFWKESITAGISSQVSSWIFILDIFFIGLLLNEKFVADYRVSSIIPFNLLIISQVFMQTDLPKICKKNTDKHFLRSYIKNYLLMMFFISLGILVLGNIFAGNILSFFGDEYKETKLFRILLLVSVFSITFRALFGALLYAVGKVQWNLYIAIVSAIFFSIGLYFITPIMGLVGVAWLSVINVFLVSLASGLMFFKQYSQL